MNEWIQNGKNLVKLKMYEIRNWVYNFDLSVL